MDKLFFPRPLVGFIPGSAEVSQTGAAQYQVPIQVPPGITEATTPNLKLVYSSQSGNGVLGVGWSLRGLSSIVRCQTSLYKDGYIDAVDFDSNDQLCFGGERMVLVSGNHLSHGAEYRTEVDGVTKIMINGTSGDGPSGFIVYHKNGTRSEYGNYNDSTLYRSGSSDMYGWQMSKRYDFAGNLITYHYSWNGTIGQSLLSEISYGDNHSVVFQYDDRSDDIVSYLFGSPLSTVNRMTEIQIFSQGNLSHYYPLSYVNSPDTGRQGKFVLPIKP